MFKVTHKDTRATPMEKLLNSYHKALENEQTNSLVILIPIHRNHHIEMGAPIT